MWSIELVGGGQMQFIATAIIILAISLNGDTVTDSSSGTHQSVPEVTEC